ncbi:hypothetical protein FHQ18_10005 [Deferribacter autotrophicus]|uniref:DsrE family protein n=1 Tax=Deferribacter autotrophicus TaxID=500465 RepID=A0A5A8F352_9BACT|nr:hypothetical protein [Deferribacter autotrophicus]KAA0257371.1 hypothetical protein FHQ18_10005 [Deferribacter autotrophicus]
MAKILIWLASGKKELLEPGITYGINAKKYGWVEDVKFVIFGQAEKLLLEDEELFKTLQEHVEPVYCKFVADQKGISEKLEEKGAKVIYVGEFISNLIKEGYEVLTF